MSFTLIQSATSTTVTATTTMTATFASAMTAGNLIVAVVSFFGGSNLPTITQVVDTKLNGSGGKYIAPTNGSAALAVDNVIAAVFYAFNIASATAGTNVVTMTGTNVSGFAQLTVCEFSSTGGSFTSDPIDVANNSKQTFGGSTVAPSVTLTTTGANRLCVGISIGDAGQTAVGTIAGSTATLLSNSGSNGDVSEYGTSSSGTSVVCTTQPNDDGWAMAFAAFKAPGGAALTDLASFASVEPAYGRPIRQPVDSVFPVDDRSVTTNLLSRWDNDVAIRQPIREPIPSAFVGNAITSVALGELSNWTNDTPAGPRPHDRPASARLERATALALTPLAPADTAPSRTRQEVPTAFLGAPMTFAPTRYNWWPDAPTRPPLRVPVDPPWLGLSLVLDTFGTWPGVQDRPSFRAPAPDPPWMGAPMTFAPTLFALWPDEPRRGAMRAPDAGGQWSSPPFVTSSVPWPVEPALAKWQRPGPDAAWVGANVVPPAVRELLAFGTEPDPPRPRVWRPEDSAWLGAHIGSFVATAAQWTNDQPAPVHRWPTHETQWLGALTLNLVREMLPWTNDVAVPVFRWPTHETAWQGAHATFAPTPFGFWPSPDGRPPTRAAVDVGYLGAARVASPLGPSDDARPLMTRLAPDLALPGAMIAQVALWLVPVSSDAVGRPGRRVDDPGGGPLDSRSVILSRLSQWTNDVLPVWIRTHRDEYALHFLTRIIPPTGPFPSVQTITSVATVTTTITAVSTVLALITEVITMSGSNLYVGDVSVVTCTVTDQFGALQDPGVVTANVQTPDKVVTAQTVTRVSKGVYSFTYTWLQQFGYTVQFQGTLPYPFNNYQPFSVLASPF